MMYLSTAFRDRDGLLNLRPLGLLDCTVMVYWSTEFTVRDLAPNVIWPNLLRTPLDLRFQELR